MTFNDQIRSLSNQEIADIFQFASIEAKKFYKRPHCMHLPYRRLKMLRNAEMHILF